MELKDRVKNCIKGTAAWQIYLSEKAKRSYQNNNEGKIKIIYSFRGKERQFKSMLAQMEKADLCADEFFYYSIDTGCIIASNYRLISNLSIDYSKILKAGLCSLIDRNGNNKMVKQNNELLGDVISFNKSMQKKFEVSNNEFSMRHKINFEKMLNDSADSLEDAFQRILFWNQFLWQSQHNLLGLGRLDKILWDAYCKGVEKNEASLQVIKKFLLTVHKYYDYKSAALRGDTGQMIILGGIDPDGSYFSNELSYLFLRAIRELHLPDPKFIVRVSRNMPEELLREALLTIASGLGNPLLSNDDLVVPCLEEFYGDRITACNYVTTACWAPVSYGNSISQCNLCVGEFTYPFIQMMHSELVKKIASFDELLELYFQYLDKYWWKQLDNNDSIKWEKDLLISFFTEGCIEKEKDISEGGAYYNDYGVQSIGLSNTVNSLFFIKKFVFTNPEFTLEQVKKVMHDNFLNQDTVWIRLKNEKVRFGNDDQEILDITNAIIERTKCTISKRRNRYCGKTKLGLSSPAFITAGHRTSATFDGRKKNEPLGVQISSDQDISYTELVRFASKLKYDSYCSNGNVIDLIITENIIQNQFDKVMDFIKSSIEVGMYQMQFNVLSYKSLLEAKNNPEKYRNLIVRVWGFNAYFNDLPDEYKDLLIQRAKRAEQGLK